MRKATVAILLGMSIALLPQGALSQDTQKELKEKKAEEIKKEQEQIRKAEEALKAEETHRKLIDLQKTVQDQQKALGEMMAWTRFPLLQFTLDKKEYRVNETIQANFSIKNGSGKPFWVDGRLVAPVYEIRDEKRKAVFVSKRADHPLPLKKNLRKVKPGESIQFPKVEGIRVGKPGRYTIRGSYVFFGPEEEMEEVWTGAISTFPVTFTVVQEKNP